MRKMFFAAAWLAVFSLVLFLSLPASALAGTLTFDADTNIALPNGRNIVVKQNSAVEEMVINNDSTITMSVVSGSTVTFEATEGWKMQLEGNNSTCSGTTSSISLTATATQTWTLIVTSDICGGNTGGSSGGGGGGTVVAKVTPTNTSVSINAGNAKTDSINVTLTLGATNATVIMVSNKSDFSDVSSWTTYVATKSWTLLSGVGTKTVYAKFRSADGMESAVINDTIELTAVAESATGTIASTGAGTVALSDNAAAVTMPAGAVSGSGTVSITPSTTYTAPAAGSQVVGGEIYDLAVTVGTSAVSTFSKAVTLTFIYTDAEIKDFDEATLKVYYWSETDSKWVLLGGTVDAANNKITVTTTHFTKFAVIGTVKTVSRAGKLVKLACPANADANNSCKAVYYIGNNGKRYVFPHEKTFKTWYADFSTVETIGAADLASYMIGGNVTYRPGVKMIKINTDPKVYAIGKGGALRWLKTAEVAKAIYGNSWSSLVEDVADSFFVNYLTGSDIAAAADFDKTAVTNASATINIDKGL